MSPTVLLSAGDASGDAYAAELAGALRARRPGIRFVGMGGAASEKAGVELAVHQRELAVGGLLELAGGARGIVRAWRGMCRALDAARPDLVVLIDSGGFHLPFARRVRRRTGAPILYYIAPQVWAWRRGRIRKLAARVDRLAVIFPFEAELYAGTGVRADFVGHPLVDSLSGMASLPREQARRELGLAAPRLVALFPGSRRNEVARHLPIQLSAARSLHVRDPRIGFALALAPSIGRAAVEGLVARAGLPSLLSLAVVEGRSPALLRAADVVLTKPGTTTLEAALLGRPMVVMGRANAVTAALLRRVVRVPHLAMPNLIADAPVVPELLQEDARPERIAEELGRLLEGPAREAQLAALSRVRERLGSSGCAERVAEIADEMLRRGPRLP